MGVVLCCFVRCGCGFACGVRGLWEGWKEGAEERRKKRGGVRRGWGGGRGVCGRKVLRGVCVRVCVCLCLSVSVCVCVCLCFPRAVTMDNLVSDPLGSPLVNHAATR